MYVFNVDKVLENMRILPEQSWQRDIGVSMYHRNIR